jgi:hypothetical protein
MIVLAGAGTLTIDGQELPLVARRVVRLDPEAVRQVRGGQDGLSSVTVGAPRDEPYLERCPY